MPAAHKFTERNADFVVLLNHKADAIELEDDPYADYQIPDDLSW